MAWRFYFSISMFSAIYFSFAWFVGAYLFSEYEDMGELVFCIFYFAMGTGLYVCILFSLIADLRQLIAEAE